MSGFGNINQFWIDVAIVRFPVTEPLFLPFTFIGFVVPMTTAGIAPIPGRETSRNPLQPFVSEELQQF